VNAFAKPCAYSGPTKELTVTRRYGLRDLAFYSPKGEAPANSGPNSGLRESD
jgi:hypothetical protein